MNKKISQIVAYSVLAVVVVGLILCSIIKINFQPEVAVPTTTEIGKIQIKATNDTTPVESDNEIINVEVLGKKFNNAFSLSILYSVFSGKIGNEVSISKVETLPVFSGFEVQFIYKDKQTLKKDGKDYLIADNSTTAVTYDRIVFDVQDAKGLTEVNLYAYTNGQKNYYQLKTIANFDELYNHIKEIPMFGE